MAVISTPYRAHLAAKRTRPFAAILIVTIAPQLLNYILAGFAGCAATPRYVWQFEKVAIWSLIKFLAAFGGISIAEALGFYAQFGEDALTPDEGGFGPDHYVEFFLWGIGAIGLAFVVAVLHVYALKAADGLGEAWDQKKTSLPYTLHRFFTRHLPQEEAARR